MQFTGRFTGRHEGLSRRGVLTAAAAGGTALALGGSGTSSAAAVSLRHSERDRRRARAIAARMTLEQKIGQLFVVEVYGQEAEKAYEGNRKLYGVDTPAQVVAKYRPGGVIYFDARRGDDNLRDPAQIAKLSNGLQRHSALPLLISTDQEGGSAVFRLTAPATELPGNMALGAGRSRRDAARSAEIIGTELASLGINQNYGPVSDVNINPDNPVIGVRSFGSSPELVSELAGAAVRGYHRGGVASAAKHFPGHGDTDTDSHFGLPRINHTRAQLDSIDLPPFREAIARGVDTVMTAHIVVPALDDSGVPATMSHKIVTGLLREELGFQGLIVTDALDMQGAAGQFPPDVAPVQALKAGADMLVLAPKMDTAFGAVLSAVRKGEVSERRVTESVVRVLEHKLSRGLFKDRYVDEGRAVRVVGNPRHTADAAAITDRGVTLVKNEGGLLPLSPAMPRRVLVTGWHGPTTSRLAEAIGTRVGQAATALETGTAPDQAAIDRAVARARESDLVVVSSNAVAAGTEKGVAQAKLVRALRETGKPVVVLGVRNPYDIKRFPEVAAYVASYSYTKPSLTSLAKVLYGELNPSGRLPVSITALGDPDKTLYPYGHGLTY